jgi:Domain of unknown function (DUF4926)
MDHSLQRRLSAVYLSLGEVMDDMEKENRRLQVNELDVVALLSDIPHEKLKRGQVGTVVDLPGNGVALVEFSDNNGTPYAFAAISESQLLPLIHESRAA